MDILVWAGLRTLRRERGQDMAEYALLLAFIAILVTLAVTGLGHVISATLYNKYTGVLINHLP